MKKDTTYEQTTYFVIIIAVNAAKERGMQRTIHLPQKLKIKSSFTYVLLILTYNVSC